LHSPSIEQPGAVTQSLEFEVVQVWQASAGFGPMGSHLPLMLQPGDVVQSSAFAVVHFWQRFGSLVVSSLTQSPSMLQPGLVVQAVPPDLHSWHGLAGFCPSSSHSPLMRQYPALTWAVHVPAWQVDVLQGGFEVPQVAPVFPDIQVPDVELLLHTWQELEGRVTPLLWQVPGEPVS